MKKNIGAIYKAISNLIFDGIVDSASKAFDTLKQFLKSGSITMKSFQKKCENLYVQVYLRFDDKNDYVFISKNSKEIFECLQTKTFPVIYEILVMLTLCCPFKLQCTMLSKLFQGENNRATDSAWIIQQFCKIIETTIKEYKERTNKEEPFPIWFLYFIKFFNRAFDDNIDVNSFTFPQKSAYDFANHLIQLNSFFYENDFSKIWKCEIDKLINHFISINRYFIRQSDDFLNLYDDYKISCFELPKNKERFFIQRADFLLHNPDYLKPDALNTTLNLLHDAYIELRTNHKLYNYNIQDALEIIFPCLKKYYFHPKIREDFLDYLNVIYPHLNEKQRESIKDHFIKYNEIEKATNMKIINFNASKQNTSKISNFLIKSIIENINYQINVRIDDKERIMETMEQIEKDLELEQNKPIITNEEIKEFSLMPFYKYNEMKEKYSIFGEITDRKY